MLGLLLMDEYSSVKVGESRGVRDWIIKMEDTRAWLLKLQASHGVEVSHTTCIFFKVIKEEQFPGAICNSNF